MRVLPALTQLPSARLSRSHEPKQGTYTTYRDCCRWEFAFTCALCFLHESDLVEGGAEGTGLIWIEHHELKSTANDRRNDYTNCLLSCRLCNNGRSAIPKKDAKTGASLLDPTEVAWAERFAVGDDLVMRPRREDDADAEYTRTAYGLESLRKAALRKNRQDRFDFFWKSVERVSDLLPNILKSARDTDDIQQKALLTKAASALEAAYDAAWREVSRYVLIPDDAPRTCRCLDDRRTDLALPRWLADQAQTLAERSEVK